MAKHKKYRKQWVDAEYDERMGSAWSDRLDCVWHFTSAEFAISDIALSRLKVARFSDVNAHPL